MLGGEIECEHEMLILIGVVDNRVGQRGLDDPHVVQLGCFENETHSIVGCVIGLLLEVGVGGERGHGLHVEQIIIR